MTSRATLGEIRVAGNPITTNQGFKSLVPRREVDNWYLFYQLQFTKARYATFGIGTTFLEVNKSDTENFLVLCPPLPTQRRIAAVLRTVDEVIEATEARIEKQQAIKQGLLHDLFTRGVTPDGQLRPPSSERPDLYRESELGVIPREWEVKRVDDLGTVMLGRQRSPAHQSGRFTTPYLRVANVFDGFIDFSDVLEMDFTPKERETFSLESGDILLNEGQSMELVGRSAIYEGPQGVYCFQNSLVRFRCNSENNPCYFQPLFKTWLDAGRFMQVALRTTSIAHLGAQRFARMKAVHPSPAEQDSVARMIESAKGKIDELQDRLIKLRHLKSALMQDLLTGRVSADSIDLDSLPSIH